MEFILRKFLEHLWKTASGFNYSQRRFWNLVEHLWWSLFAKIVKDWKSLIIFPKNSIRDVWLNSKYTSNIQTFEIKTHKVCFMSNLCSLCNIYITLLKATFFPFLFFLNPWTRTCSSVICITISSSFSAVVSLRAF